MKLEDLQQVINLSRELARYDERIGQVESATAIDITLTKNAQRMCEFMADVGMHIPIRDLLLSFLRHDRANVAQVLVGLGVDLPEMRERKPQ